PAPNKVQSGELRGERVRIGSERNEPVDEEAAHPGIGAVPQPRPDLAGMPQPDQGRRRPRLPLRQRVLELFQARFVLTGGLASYELSLEQGNRTGRLPLDDREE